MGAGITVVTTGCVVGVVAIPIAKTDIIRADITIVTDIARAVTGTTTTNIGMGAGITIITDHGVVGIITGPVSVSVYAAQADVIRA
tara:strand:- start:2294 stop:2551 length:258 start_codon:yes stop_codon:yes gene_type:complete